jgi:branched-chain amino acid transport system substrate-binding protein
MGGQSVEGAILAQFFNRESKQATYIAFRDHYAKRFIEEPGFASVAGYDAARVLLQALIQGNKLKESIIKRGSFPGLQGEIQMDRYGDARRPIFITTVKDGKFSILE